MTPRWNFFLIKSFILNDMMNEQMEIKGKKTCAVIASNRVHLVLLCSMMVCPIILILPTTQPSMDRLYSDYTLSLLTSLKFPPFKFNGLMELLPFYSKWK